MGDIGNGTVKTFQHLSECIMFPPRGASYIPNPHINLKGSSCLFSCLGSVYCTISPNILLGNNHCMFAEILILYEYT